MLAGKLTEEDLMERDSHREHYSKLQAIPIGESQCPTVQKLFGELETRIKSESKPESIQEMERGVR